MCGVPSVYYGDEIGMQGYVDPLNRQCYPWGNEDQEILAWYKKLANIRNAYSAFESGEFEEIFKSDGVYVYKRFDEKSELLMAVNVSNSSYVIEFDDDLFDLLSGEKYSKYCELNGKSFLVLIKK